MASAGQGNGTGDSSGEELAVWGSKLLEHGGVLGYMESRSGKKGFIRKTNFRVEVVGVVKQPVTCQGAILKVTLTDGTSAITYCSYEDMSYQQSMLRALKAGLGSSLWVSGQLDPDFGSYVHELSDKYKKDGAALFKKAVEVIGKQGDDDVWVLNEKVQVDADGNLIPPEDQKYVIIGGQLKRHYLSVDDVDDGESFGELLQAMKALLTDNFIAGLWVVAGMTASVLYETLVAISADETCPVVVAYGESCCGKTAALRCAQHLIGVREVYHELTAAKASDLQQNSTMGFAWDDPENMKVVEEVAVSSYNQMLRATMKDSKKPRCMPVITTNLKTGDKVRIFSRMVVIPFEPVASHKLPFEEREVCEYDLKRAKGKASRGIGRIIALRKKIAELDNEGKLAPSAAFRQALLQIIPKFEEIMPHDEGRSARNYGIIAYLCKELLREANMEEEEEAFWHFVRTKIGPLYAEMQERAGVTRVPVTPSTSERDWLTQVFQALQTLERVETLEMVNPSYRPRPSKDGRKTCDCADAVAIHVDSLQRFLKTQGISSNVRVELRRYDYCASQKIIFAGQEHPPSNRVISKYSKQKWAPHIGHGKIDGEILQTFLSYMDAEESQSATGKDDTANDQSDIDGDDAASNKSATGKDDTASQAEIRKSGRIKKPTSKAAALKNYKH